MNWPRLLCFRRHQMYRERNAITGDLELVCAKCFTRVPVAMTNVVVFPVVSAEELSADVVPFRKRVGQ